jgi:hypothetical protein
MRSTLVIQWVIFDLGSQVISPHAFCRDGLSAVDGAKIKEALGK